MWKSGFLKKNSKNNIKEELVDEQKYCKKLGV